MSDPEQDGGGATLLGGPESPHVVDAVDALLRGDIDEARAILTEGADLTSWEAVAHRLDVAGRGLAFDACVEFGDERGAMRLVAEVNRWTRDDVDEIVDLVQVPEVLDRWCEAPASHQSTPTDQVWTALGLLSWLVDRADYPPEVVL